MDSFEKKLRQELKNHLATKEVKKTWKNDHEQKVAIGTKKIYCIILKEIVKEGQFEHINITFDEYSDYSKKVCFLWSISINGKNFILDKTDFDNQLLQQYLSLFEFDYFVESNNVVSINTLSLEKITSFQTCQRETLERKQVRFTGYRSKVCDSLADIPKEDKSTTLVKKYFK